MPNKIDFIPLHHQTVHLFQRDESKCAKMKETIQENLGVIEGTTAIGADGREALSKRWVAALVQVRNEKAVGKKLTDLKIENYVATQWEIHQWSDRKKKVEQVVIPMIVFIHTD